MRTNCGIYKIENIINKKCYIGQSIDLNKRRWGHFNNLENNNGDNQHLQYAYNKYGKDNFKFSILLYCEKFELTRYEKFFDNHYKKLNLSYNIRECADTNKGIILSDKTKKKISKATKGENNPFYGKNHSEETKEKMSLNHANFSKKNHPMFGKKHSEETRKKISDARKGKPGNRLGTFQTEETRKKISKLNKGKNHPQYGKHRSEETRKKISESNKGKQLSEEHKRKLSESAKTRKNNKKIKN